MCGQHYGCVAIVHIIRRIAYVLVLSPDTPQLSDQRHPRVITLPGNTRQVVSYVHLLNENLGRIITNFTNFSHAQ